MLFPKDARLSALLDFFKDDFICKALKFWMTNLKLICKQLFQLRRLSVHPPVCPKSGVTLFIKLSPLSSCLRLSNEMLQIYTAQGFAKLQEDKV